MKMSGIRKIVASVIIGAIATAVVGCADDVSTLVPTTGSAINFSVALSTQLRSRADGQSMPHGEAAKFGNANMWLISSEKNTVADAHTDAKNTLPSRTVLASVSAVDKFYVRAYVYDGEGEWEDNYGVAVKYLSEEVSKKSDGMWSGASPQYWPGGNYVMKFFGHTFLYQGETDEITGKATIANRESTDGASINASKNWPVVKYESAVCNDDLVVSADVVSDDASTYASTLPGDYQKPVVMHFYHALTAVTFTAEADMEDDIESITISNIRVTGKHSFGDDVWTFYASDGSEYAKSSLTFPLTKSSDTEASAKMVIPQTLDDAVVTVKFKTGSELTANLDGKRWKCGTNVTYHISDSKEYNEWVIGGLDDLTLSWMGGEASDTIKSYVIQHKIHDATGVVDVSVIPVPWTATANESWISISSGSGAGTDENGTELLTIVAGQQESTYTNEHNDVLQHTATVSGIYDLSTKGGTAACSTANCYLVNAPGTYKLPLVFGNAITKGEVNENAYYIPSSQINGMNASSKLSRFKSYDRTEITTPYIYELHNGSSVYKDVVADATLCWQDAKDLVTNVRLDSDKKYLLFDVNASTIAQGNAVVAVRDSQKRIMWSWHIWVTDYVLGSQTKTVTNHGVPGEVDFMTNHFMPYNLGYCDEGTYTYSERSGTITVTQTYGGESHSSTFSVRQREHVFHPSNNTYYQWGRKDPMLPGYFQEDGKSYDPVTKRYQLVVSNKEQFCTDNTYKFRLSTSGESGDIANGIQYPYVFFTSTTNWCNWMVKMVVNFWNGANSGDVWKTIYDPCPPGFVVPSAKVFTGFTWDGNSVVDIPVNDEAQVTEIFDEAINSYFRTVDDFTRNFGFTFYCDHMTGKGVYSSANGTINFPVIGYRVGDGSSDTPLDVGYYSFTWSGNPDFSQGAAWYMIFGISPDYIDIRPRTLGADDTRSLPINLAHAFSVRAIREY